MDCARNCYYFQSYICVYDLYVYSCWYSSVAMPVSREITPSPQTWTWLFCILHILSHASDRLPKDVSQSWPCSILLSSPMSYNISLLLAHMLESCFLLCRCLPVPVREHGGGRGRRLRPRVEIRRIGMNSNQSVSAHCSGFSAGLKAWLTPSIQHTFTLKMTLKCNFDTFIT